MNRSHASSGASGRRRDRRRGAPGASRRRWLAELATHGLRRADRRLDTADRLRGNRRARPLVARRVYWGDERCVPPDHPDSNSGMAKAALLDRLSVPPMAVHRMRGELGKDDGADAYEEDLGHAALDLVLLGLGPDGHVASLYPDQPTLEIEDRRVVGAEGAARPSVDRITLTLPTLRAARVPRRQRGQGGCRRGRVRGASPIPRRPAASCAARRAARGPCSTQLQRRSSSRSSAAAATRAAPRQLTARGERLLQDEHRVGDRHLFEILVARLERGEHVPDRGDIAHAILGGDRRERVGDCRRKVFAIPDLRDDAARLDVATEHEQRQGRGVATDRRLGRRNSRLERPRRELRPRRPGRRR